MQTKPCRPAGSASFRSLAGALLLLLPLGLIGCSTGEFADLNAYVQEVKARPPGRIAPMPEFESYESFTYRGQELRDPFTPKSEATLHAAQASGPGLRPDLDRHREALENFPLDALKYVGLLENDSETWAIIKAPDNLVYRVKAGNHMGQNFGKVTAVEEGKIRLMEIVPDGLGNWVQRPAALALEE